MTGLMHLANTPFDTFRTSSSPIMIRDLGSGVGLRIGNTTTHEEQTCKDVGFHWGIGVFGSVFN